VALLNVIEVDNEIKESMKMVNWKSKVKILIKKVGEENSN